MTALSIQPTYPIFTDADGQPLESGFVWIGQANLDPQVNPQAVYWDADLTIPAVQPIRTLAGYPSNSGTPARLYVDGNYSIRVMNKKGSVVYSAPEATERYSGSVIGSIDASQVSFTADGANVFVRDARQKFIENSVSVLDFLNQTQRDDVINRYGLVDVSDQIRNALDYAVSVGKSLYMPSGLYMFKGCTIRNSTRAINPLVATGDSIVIFGDGPGNTVIKEFAGQNAINGRFDMMFYFLAGPGVTLENVVVFDLTIDKNGASNGTPPTTYEWEQSHMIGVSADWTTGYINNQIFDNVELLDKTGGGIVLMAGYMQQAVINNCHGRDFGGLVGQRGDFEFQAMVTNLVVESSTGLYAQCEPDISVPAAGIFPVAAFRNCVIPSLEFTAFAGSAAAVKAQTIVLDNCVAMGKLTVRDAKLLARNSKFVVGSGQNDYWRRLAQGSVVDGCTVITRYNAGTNSISPFYPRAEATLGGFYCDFVNCIIEPGEGASGTTTGAAVNSVAGYTGAQPYLVKFIDCQFSPLFQQTVNAYFVGIYEFVRCKIAGWGTQAMQVGAYSTFIGKLTIEDCDFSQCTSTYNVYYNNSNALWELTWRGSHKYTDFKVSYSAANPDLYTKFNGIFTAGATPAAAGIKGMRVRVSNPSYGNGGEYICTVNSASSGTFRLSSQFGVKKDTTANRPVLGAADIGGLHLDTTLDADGKPIWWTGTAWVDATGLVV